LHLILALMLAIPSESLVARLEPVRQAVAQVATLAQSGRADSLAVQDAVRAWSNFTAAAGSDTSALPEGWANDTKLITSRFSALESPTQVAALLELLYWLPRPKPVLLKFTGYQCEKCVVMEQVLGKVAAEYGGRARIRTIDVNKDEAAARQRKITVVPTMVFLDASGKEVARVAREMTEAEVRSRIDLLLMHD
jgi:thiol-disulfide isomerase/thioredoxin